MWSAKFYNFVLEAENQTPSLKVSNDPLDAKKRQEKKRRWHFCKESRSSSICFFLFCVCLTSGVYHAPSFQGRRVGKTCTTKLVSYDTLPFSYRYYVFSTFFFSRLLSETFPTKPPDLILFVFAQQCLTPHASTSCGQLEALTLSIDQGQPRPAWGCAVKKLAIHQKWIGTESQRTPK